MEEDKQKILLDALSKISKWQWPIGADKISLLYHAYTMRECAMDALNEFYKSNEMAKKTV